VRIRGNFSKPKGSASKNIWATLIQMTDGIRKWNPRIRKSLWSGRIISRSSFTIRSSPFFQSTDLTCLFRQFPVKSMCPPSFSCETKMIRRAKKFGKHWARRPMGSGHGIRGSVNRYGPDGSSLVLPSPFGPRLSSSPRISRVCFGSFQLNQCVFLRSLSKQKWFGEQKVWETLSQTTDGIRTWTPRIRNSFQSRLCLSVFVYQSALVFLPVHGSYVSL